MLFIVHGYFEKREWDDCKKALKNRKKKADVKAVIELVTPGDYKFTGVYESKDATSLYKYLKRLEGLHASDVMPALPVDNILIIDEVASKDKKLDDEE